MNHDIRRLLQNDDALSQAMRGLPRMAPVGMTTRLRVLASWERERAISQGTWRIQFQGWMDRVHLAMQNVMRPLAVPVAGGVFSAVTLFNVWVVPAYPALAARTGVDVPTQLSTEARAKRLTDIGNAQGDIVVDIMLDARGQLVDYEVVGGFKASDAATRVNFENLLVFSEFIPATSFGKPKAGKMRLWVSSSRIDVKG